MENPIREPISQLDVLISLIYLHITDIFLYYCASYGIMQILLQEILDLKDSLCEQNLFLRVCIAQLLIFALLYCDF